MIQPLTTSTRSGRPSGHCFFFQLMRHLHAFLLVAALALAACSSDDNDNSPSVTNENANTLAGTTRLEFPHVQPTGNLVIQHTDDFGEPNYAVEWNISLKAQQWVCYTMTASNMINNNVGRYDNRKPENSPTYPEDPDLPSELYFKADPFYRSGYDHGHLVASQDRQRSDYQNMQTFYLTNMAPQLNRFNAGIWLKMEQRLQRLGRNRQFADTIFVCKGGTIGATTGTLGKGVYERRSNGLVVPRYFFVAALMVKGGNYQSVGLLFDQFADTKEVLSIDDLERRTGFDFFCNLPDQLEQQVESRFSATLWNF